MDVGVRVWARSKAAGDWVLARVTSAVRTGRRLSASPPQASTHNTHTSSQRATLKSTLKWWQQQQIPRMLPSLFLLSMSSCVMQSCCPLELQHMAWEAMHQLVCDTTPANQQTLAHSAPPTHSDSYNRCIVCSVSERPCALGASPRAGTAACAGDALCH